MRSSTLGCVTALAIALSSASAAAKPKPVEPAAANAQKRTELPVLGVSSDEAEDQAEALSGALRSRLRNMQGVTLDEASTMNLSTLTSALGCAPQPDPLCLLKIGDQLKVDRFVWGTMRKGPERGQVTADIHSWRRGKPDTVVSETFSDNLRDQNDDVLRRIAGRIVDKLMGQAIAAPVLLRVGDAFGEVIVDGTEHVPLARGEATLELKPGLHTLEVRAKGMPPEKHEVEVTSTAEQVLSIKLGEQKEEPPAKPISGRKVAALGFVGLGVGFGIAGVVKGLQFLSIQSDNKRDHDTIRAEDFCDTSKPFNADVNTMDDACKRLERGRDARLLGFVFGGIAVASLGTGLVLLLTDTSSNEKAAMDSKPTKPSALRVVPHVGFKSGGVDLSMRF